MIQESRNRLDDNSNYCLNCPQYGLALIRFEGTIPTEYSLEFGEEMSIDLMLFDGKAELDVADTATKFSKATFLDTHGVSHDQSTGGIWLAHLVW